MSIGAALRQSLRDLYFNSWRLAPANLLWGLVLILAIVAGPFTIIGVGLFILLVLPTVGLYRMGGLIARGEPAAFTDFLGAMGRYGPVSLAIAVGATVLAFVLATNVLVGIREASPLGWFVSAMALWGLVGLGMFLTAFWPILVDPERPGVGLRQRLWLAGLAVIGRPMRMLGLTVVIAVILAISSVFFAAIVLVSVAYVAVLSARVVLPLVDEVEARLPEARRAR